MLAIRFISGKYQGKEWILPSYGEIVIGRSSELNLVLSESLVSRIHAKIICENQKIFIEDLESSNGTFVNGQRISKIELQEGDRILLGSSIFKVTSPSSKAPIPFEPRATDMSDVESTSSSIPKTMSGLLEEISLADLLQLFGSSRKTGILTLDCDSNHGTLGLRRGRICFAELREDNESNPKRCMLTMLQWGTGTFGFDVVSDKKMHGDLDLSVEDTLMELLQKLDEMNSLEAQSTLGRRLKLIHPLVAKLSDLPIKELDMLQLVYNVGDLEMILQNYSFQESEALTLLKQLMKEKFIENEVQ